MLKLFQHFSKYYSYYFQGECEVEVSDVSVLWSDSMGHGFLQLEGEVWLRRVRGEEV
jgi:hypothetical protein